MIDANAFLGEWPFRRLPYAQPEDRLRKMDALGIEKAVVSRLENIFYKDLLVGNEELHAIVQRYPDRFIPAYTINPGFPGWEHDLEICINDFGMRNLRLHPNYHQYSRLKGNVPRMVEARGNPNYQQYHFLDDQAQALLGKAEEHDLVVLISIGVEDPRFAHWLMKVPAVTTIDAAEAVNGFPGVRFLICGAVFSEVTSLWSTAYHRDNLYFENSRVQGPIGDVDDLCALMGADHLLFGSNLPINYAESAKLSIEYAEVAADVKQALFKGNAERLFGA